jgi:hypothetical protein
MTEEGEEMGDNINLSLLLPPSPSLLLPPSPSFSPVLFFVPSLLYSHFISLGSSSLQAQS